MKLLISFLLFLSALTCNCDTLQILFLGDTYFGESYQTNPKYNRGINVTEQYGYDYFFENVKDLLLSADYTIANLETSLYESDEVKFQKKPYSHWSYAEKTCRILKKYNIRCLSLGNNHVMDYGTEGLKNTVGLLEKYEIEYFGAGENINNASKPLIKVFSALSDTFRIAVIGGFEYRPNYDTLYHYYASDIKPGVNKIDTSEILKQIQNLRKIYPDVFIVFFPHWGKNYKQVQEYQKEIAYNVIDGGADLVIGHGAHTIQETEEYKGKHILYNIGNFIFNAPGRFNSTGALPYSYIVKMMVINGKVKLQLIPIFVNNKECDYKVRFLNESEYAKLKQKDFEFIY
jgi:poly-gamma-glutamate capsule biosynthesis protein CapA/YwtB (metallophosphatase superfamily)